MDQRHVCTFWHALRAAYRTAISAAQILVIIIIMRLLTHLVVSTCQVIGWKDPLMTPSWGEQIISTKPRWKRTFVCNFFSFIWFAYVAMCFPRCSLYILKQLTTSHVLHKLCKAECFGIDEVGFFLRSDAFLSSSWQCQTSAAFICVKGNQRFSLVMCVVWLCTRRGQHNICYADGWEIWGQR